MAIASLLFLLALLAWFVWIWIGLRSVARTGGTLTLSGLSAPVTIARDGRDIPHIRAANLHDLFFAQGFAEGSDRLFQMDLMRRFVYGDLAAVIGPAALPTDEDARTVDIRGIVARQWAKLRPADRDALAAFSQGVNAAMRTQPLPAEFHLLLYRPAPWTPQDSLAVGMSLALDLVDPWQDVIARNRLATDPQAAPAPQLYSITDPRYDAPIAPARPAPVPSLGPLPAHLGLAPQQPGAAPPLTRGGSNEWAIGAARSANGHAMLANDPHLQLGIPGIWYLVELRAPHFHVAGASLAGTPYVILGHDDDVAWGATNGTVTTETVYRDPLAGARRRIEHFHVRFGKDAVKTYYRTKHGFVAAIDGAYGDAVDWQAAANPQSPLVAFTRLDRATSIASALAALRAFPGPPQNFVLASRDGRVAYHLAGLIPNDPSWGFRVHDAGAPSYPYLPFNALPHVTPSRDGMLFTANNRMYGAGYPYRLTSNFTAPYRAARIRTLLDRHRPLTAGYLARMQLDTYSIPDAAIAKATVAAATATGVRHDPVLQPYLDALSRWNGRFDPGSRGAAIAKAVRERAVAALAQDDAAPFSRLYLESAQSADLVLLMRVIRERPRGWTPHGVDALLVAALRGAVRAQGRRLLEPWKTYGAVPIRHPLAGLGFNVFNGVTLPGNGDRYTVHVQAPDLSQSFRAVWIAGDWDAGGIAILSGESGEAGSPDYRNLSRAWVAGRLSPLPYSAAAVKAATVRTLTLRP